MTVVHPLATWHAHAHSSKYPYRYRCTHAQLTAGRFLSTDYPRYPTGFTIPHFIITWFRSSNSNDEVQSLRDKVSKGLDKYLQDAEQCHALELNYFDDTTRPTSVEPMSEAAEQTNKSSEHNLSSAKQTPM